MTKPPADDQNAAHRPAARPASRSVSSSRETAKPSDSVPLPTGPFAALPADFGRYRVIKLLGRGQMGAVYLAHDRELERDVALKVARVSSSGSVKLLERMKIEAKAAARVDDPRVCKVYELGEVSGIRFIAQQYVPGEDLKSQSRRLGRKRPPAEAVALLLELTKGLRAAHAQGVIHRDLKPENVMIRPDGTPVIMDFGLARVATVGADAEKTQAGTVLGSAAYMSVEQARGDLNDIDERSDLYGVGVMLFELLTGTWPFTGNALTVMGQKCVIDAPSILALDPQLPPILADICGSLLERSKENRCPSCDELIRALEYAQSELQLQSAVPTPQTIVEPMPVLITAEPHGLRGSRRLNPSVKVRRATLAHPIFWVAATIALVSLSLFAVVIYFPPSQGTVRIEIDDPTLSVRFNGDSFTIDNDGHPISITPGESHMLEVLQGGVALEGAAPIILNRGEKRIFKVSLIAGQAALNGKQLSKRATSGKVVAAPQIPDDAVSFHFKKWKLFRGRLTWHEAQQKCESIGGRLAQIHSSAENQFALNLMTTSKMDGVWLGATDEIKEGSWRWNDGSEVVYENWSRPDSQPNNENHSRGHYLMMVDNGQWVDQPNESMRYVTPGYLCVWDDSAVRESINDPAMSQAPPDAADACSGLVNGDFKDNFAGWTLEGGASAFGVYPLKVGGDKFLTTWSRQHIDANTGRVHQTFTLPSNADTLRFMISGGASKNTYIGLLHNGNIYKSISAKNDNDLFLVMWDIKPLRGEEVTLEIVDYSTSPWGFIAICDIRVLCAAPVGNSVNYVESTD